MSGIEILGAVAATVQLVESGSKIVNLVAVLRSQVRDAPASLERRLTQVGHLVDVARLIECSPRLQTELMRSLLVSSIWVFPHMSGSFKDI